jgi:hypothetical protein
MRLGMASIQVTRSGVVYSARDPLQTAGGALEMQRAIMAPGGDGGGPNLWLHYSMWHMLCGSSPRGATMCWRWIKWVGQGYFLSGCRACI